MKMTRAILLSLVICFLSIGQSLNAQGFEGQFILKSTVERAGNPEQAPTITCLVKGTKILAEVEGGRTGSPYLVIYDGATGDYTSVSERDGVKTAMKNNIKSSDNYMVNAMKQARSSFSSSTTKPQLTNESKEIHGHVCAKYFVESKDEQAEIWVAKDIFIDLTDVLAILNIMDIEPNPYGVEGFVMDANIQNKTYQTNTRLTIELSPKTLEENAFQLPDDVKVNDMQARNDLMEEMRNTRDPEKLRELMQKMRETSGGR